MRTFALAGIFIHALALSGAAGAAAGGVVWEKPEMAQAKSAATGMPICYFFTQNAAQKDGSTWAAGAWEKSLAAANGAFASDSTASKTGFIYVKGTQKLANQYQIKGSPVALVVDPDGEELARTPLASGQSALDAALEKASAKYANREISWGSDVPSASSEKKLLVVGFEDEKGETLKLLEDRRIAKYHGRMTFVKLAYQKDGEAAKKWGVSSLPSVYLCDATKENPEKNVLEKLTGKKNESALKAAVQRALFKLDARK